MYISGLYGDFQVAHVDPRREFLVIDEVSLLVYHHVAVVQRVPPQSDLLFGLQFLWVYFGVLERRGQFGARRQLHILLCS